MTPTNTAKSATLNTVSAPASTPSSALPSGPVKLYPVRDSMTMLRRNVKNQLRDKVAIMAIVGIPVLFLLLFVYVFGGALGESLPNIGKGHYVDYVLPGLIIMTAAAGLIGTSTATAVDMTEGIIARFRTMAIFRPAILIARVISSVIQTVLSMVFVLAIAMLMGFRTHNTSALNWLAAAGVLVFISFALAWLGLAFGLAAKTVASASNGPFPLIMLPLVGSGIVPTKTMPTGVRYFAQYQPFTPMTEATRGLLLGGH
ncbi:MAG: ABC transporter permease, partial [Jatrophihabitantaceae bacterium]